MNRTHFHSLDALRTLAFLKVFLLHIPIVAFPFFTFIKNGGGIGVSFFFTLSGFLITYIILEEKKSTGVLDLKKFFIRRCLRIWPLFYAMILFAFLTPYILGLAGISGADAGYVPNWLHSCLFLENYEMMLHKSMPNVSPLGVMWSLCVEEHFYILWGTLLYWLKAKHVPIAILCSIVLANLCRVYYFYYLDLEFLDLFTNLDYFAYGAIPAYLLSMRESILESTIQRIPRFAQYSILLLTLASVLLLPNLKTPIPLLEPTLLGLLFSMCLSLFVCRSSSVKFGEKNILTRMGLYTYGLYLFHGIVINLLLQVVGRIGLSLDDVGGAAIFFFGALALSLLFSVLSYHIFELPFLRLKRFFYS